MNLVRQKNLLLTNPLKNSPVTLGYVLAALLLCTPPALLNIIPQTDVATRYAPMAEAFAAGDWSFAFHSRFLPLFPTVSGLLCSLPHVDGFLAVKLASALFFALGVIPLFSMFEIIFDRKTAHISAILYLFYPHILRLACSGLRDTSKGFFLLLAIYGVLHLFHQPVSKKSNRWNPFTGTLSCIAGCSGLILARGDCALYALLLLLATLFIRPRQAVLAGIGTLLIISPWLVHQYRTIGYPVPETRHALLLEKTPLAQFKNSHARLPLTARRPSSSPKRTSSPAPAAKSTKPNHTPAKKIIRQEHSTSDFLESIYRSFHPLFAVFAFPIIFMRIKQKKWTREETFLAATLLTHHLAQVGQIAVEKKALYVSERYLATAAPLLLGWTALGVRAVAEKAGNRPALMKTICTLGLIGLYLQAGGRIIRSYTSEKKSSRRRNIPICAEWINHDWNGSKTKNPNAANNPRKYMTGMRPNILSEELSIAWFTSGQAQDFSTTRTGLSASGADYIILQNRDIHLYPNLPPPAFSTGRSSLDLVIFRIDDQQSGIK